MTLATRGRNGASCLIVSAQKGHLEVVNLEMECQNAGLSSHEITILKLG